MTLSKDSLHYLVSGRLSHQGLRMSEITASELDLLTFFESEPHWLDPDSPWLFNDLAYEYSDGVLHLSFAVAPSYKDVRIVVQRESHIIYELNAMDVLDVEYLKDGRKESLRVTLDKRDSIIIKLKPTITLTHTLAGNI